MVKIGSLGLLSPRSAEAPVSLATKGGAQGVGNATLQFAGYRRRANRYILGGRCGTPVEALHSLRSLFPSHDSSYPLLSPENKRAST